MSSRVIAAARKKAFGWGDGNLFDCARIVSVIVPGVLNFGYGAEVKSGAGSKQMPTLSGEERKKGRSGSSRALIRVDFPIFSTVKLSPTASSDSAPCPLLGTTRIFEVRPPAVSRTPLHLRWTSGASLACVFGVIEIMSPCSQEAVSLLATSSAVQPIKVSSRVIAAARKKAFGWGDGNLFDCARIVSIIVPIF
ncbi:hypothetical protein EII13_04720 [Buchananella hordeovulneris]|nr:hypothetical protein EII13_04720 [Buchananella hordeovulneris]